MRIYIPATYRATLALFRRGSAADEARINAIDDRITEAAKRLYSAIMDGTATEAHQKHTNGQLLTIYHRSTRTGVLIQASTFYRDMSGSWTASSHHDINRPEDIELHHGEYLTITEGV